MGMAMANASTGRVSGRFSGSRRQVETCKSLWPEDPKLLMAISRAKEASDWPVSRADCCEAFVL